MKVWGRLIGGAVGMAAIASPAFCAAAPSEIGATLPYKTFEAEAATTNAKVLGPDFTGHTPAREASGRQCVQLAKPGDFIEFKATADAQGIVVRYSIPDSESGHGSNATLSLSINGGAITSLPLTSKLTHLYGNYPFDNKPASGTPRNFWDEVRLLPTTPIRAGDLIRLVKTADDSGSEYLIDFIDLETVPAPIEKPADALSIMDFGGIGHADIHAAILAAMEAAKSQHKTVWIPAGHFIVKGPIDLPSDVTIRGAGMWHTTLTAVDDYSPANRIAFNGAGSNISLSDFAVVGNLNYRNDEEANDGVGGSFGRHSSIRNLWIEHTKTGMWLVNADGLIIEGCRFRDTIADGINLCVGMRNSIVRNCSSRGTGDDCFAIWPATYAKAENPPGGNRFEHCTAQLPSLAQAFSIYGGESNQVVDCEAIDIPYGAGLYASTTFPTESGFTGTTYFKQCRLTRTGDGDGAIGTVANRVDLVGVRFENIDVIDSPTDGLKFISMSGHALKDAVFDHIRIAGATGHGIVAAKDACGAAKLNNVTISRAKAGEWQNDSASFELIRPTETKQAAAGN